MMLALTRNIPQAHGSTMAGRWDRKRYLGNELYKKSLGVVGLGKIGAHVAKIAQALGMVVLAHDPFISNERAQKLQVRLVELDALFEEADYITLHIPRTNETANLVGERLLKRMKPTARLINCARGGVVDEDALVEALRNNAIAGAALDVYASEPLPEESPLRSLKENIILTPHLGASTAEAQASVAIDVAEQIRDVLLGLPARSAVNIPGLSPELMETLRAHLSLAEHLGHCISQLAGGNVQELEVRMQGELATQPSQPLVTASLKGLLSAALGERINYVNAGLEARSRGIKVLEVKDEASRDYSGGSLQLICRSSSGLHQLTGAVFAGDELRITSVDSFPISVPPSNHMLFTRHRDMPGIIGQAGLPVGAAQRQHCQHAGGAAHHAGDAVMVLSVDDPIPESLLDTITSIDGIREAHAVSL